MKAIFGEKIKMSQVFDKDGNVIPVTLIKAVPNTVLQLRTNEKDGYSAVQVGLVDRAQKNIKKPQRGHNKNLGNFLFMREIRGEVEDLKTGDKIDVSVFKEGDKIRVSGVSKSKGFQGVVKRHDFAGAPASHGTKHAHRQPGSIGGSGGRPGGRVAKGIRMAGRMGGDRITVSNLKVVKIDLENNILAVSGAVPGRTGTLLEIRS